MTIAMEYVAWDDMEDRVAKLERALRIVDNGRNRPFIFIFGDEALVASEKPTAAHADAVIRDFHRRY